MPDETAADDPVNQRLCKSCGEWYDARAQACYLCGEEASERNDALQKAVETTRLNSALARQVGTANAEGAAAQQFRSARATGRGHDQPLRGIPGYSGLVGEIKRGLAESGFGE